METRSGAAGAGEGARVALRKRLETGARSPPAGFVRAAARAALAVCFLLVPAVLLLQRWQAGPAPEWVFGADLPPEVNRGMYARVSSWPFISCRLIWLL